MVTNGSLFDCSPLDSQKGGFKDYITQLREQTGFNSTYLQFCESEICGAVWGIGNSDVSGIGVRRPCINIALHQQRLIVL